MSEHLDHYTGDKGRAYFEQRGGRGQKFQKNRAAMFGDLSRVSDTVLDFGCGTGGVLAELPAARRLGVEISELARAEAAGRLDAVFESIRDVPAGSVDVAISFHAMEHVPEPFTTFRGIHTAMKPGGRFKFFVPYDNVVLNREHRSWVEDDPIMHLYTWTPLTFGNLLAAAGFHVEMAAISPWSTDSGLERLLTPVGMGSAGRWMKAIRGGRLHVYAEGRA